MVDSVSGHVSASLYTVIHSPALWSAEQHVMVYALVCYVPIKHILYV